MKNENIAENAESTFCPEDNKLRLYCGRVERDEYLRLKAEGWKSTPKQDCDFVAVWTVGREDTALDYGQGFIGDEDQGPAERACERAERFQNYQQKRLNEAKGFADSYESKDTLHGYQSQAKADRAAQKHDRLGDKACSQWSKAEYWQSRTAGVISNALYKDNAGLRMSRIKKLEASLRKYNKELKEYQEAFNVWKELSEQEASESHSKRVLLFAGSYGSCGGSYMHPRAAELEGRISEHKTSLYSLLSDPKDPITAKEACELWTANRLSPDDDKRGSNRAIQHLKNRIAYENQMLEGQGGRLEQVDIQKGGKMGKFIIAKVNKSPATKRVTSVMIYAPAVNSGNAYQDRADIKGTKYSAMQVNTERYSPDSYKAPTEESLQELKEILKEIKESKKEAPKKPSLINPTMEDAQKLQDLWNARTKAAIIEKYSQEYFEKHSPEATQKVLELTQAQYSANSGGSYSRLETKEINTELKRHHWNSKYDIVFKLRLAPSSGSFSMFAPNRVIVITDKPQKSFPVAIEEEKKEEPTPTVYVMADAETAGTDCLGTTQGELAL